MRIVAAEAIGGAARLESLALRVFGAGDRPAGWFARKLARERVSAVLSRVAVRDDAPIGSPRAWLGYVLVGTPPSLGDAVRTAGTGVLPAARGRGIGHALIVSAAAAATGAGYRRLQIVADERTIPFYERAGLHVVTPFVTLRAHGRGDGIDRSPPGLWTPPGDHRQLCGWLPEAWAASDERCTITLCDGGVIHVSREGEAWLVHRWLVPHDARADAAPDALVRALPHGATVIVPFVPRPPAVEAHDQAHGQAHDQAHGEVSSITARLHAHADFAIVQRGALMQRFTSERARDDDEQ